MHVDLVSVEEMFVASGRLLAVGSSVVGANWAFEVCEDGAHDSEREARKVLSQSGGLSTVLPSRVEKCREIISTKDDKGVWFLSCLPPHAIN